MDPYESPSVCSVSGAARLDTPPRLRMIASTIGAAITGFSLFCWTGWIIYFIDTTYRPGMPFWAVILIGFSILAVSPVIWLVYRMARYASHRLMIVPYLLSTLLLAIVVVLTVPVISWIQSHELSLSVTYGVLALLITLPPCLFGFSLSGCVAWLAVLWAGE